MKYKGTLIAVKDIVKSKDFYKSVLNLDVVMDAGANVELTGGVFLQTVDTWANFINKSDSEIVFSNNTIELYFETDVFLSALQIPVCRHTNGHCADGQT